MNANTERRAGYPALLVIEGGLLERIEGVDEGTRMLDVPLEKIVVPENRLRELRDYSGLATSMKEIGLLQPITVTDANRLVAGRHRLEAARSLGWEKIAATVVEEDDLRNRLVEIDENLQRFDLTVYEQAKHAAERERVLEAMGQRRGEGGDGSNQHKSNPVTVTGLQDGPVTVTVPKTTEEVAGEAGLSERSWQRRTKIGKALGPRTIAVLDHADPTEEKHRGFLNSTTQLNHLADISNKRGDDRAAETAEKVLNGECKSTFDAYPEVKAEAPEPKTEPPRRQTSDGEPAIGEILEPHGVSLDERPQRTPEEEAFFPVQKKAREIRLWDTRKYAEACPEFGYLDDAINNFRELEAWARRAARDLEEERRKAVKLTLVEERKAQ